MIDIVDKNTRSKMMAGIRGKNTRPELFVRSVLHRRGYRFRIHRTDLPGSPDIVLPKYSLAIFVHGCFWHRHAYCKKAAIPGTNAGRWTDKFSANIVRDAKDISSLLANGWRVLVLWECGINSRDLNEDWLIQIINDRRETYIEWPILKASS